MPLSILKDDYRFDGELRATSIPQIADALRHFPPRFVAGNYTVTADDNRIIILDATADGFDLQLPNLLTRDGLWFWLYKADGVNGVVVLPAGAQTINGGASIGITAEASLTLIVADETNENWLATDATGGGGGGGDVPSSRTISTTSPLTGGGDLSTNRTFAIDTTGLMNLIKANDGAGSGLDADTLDGLNSTAFALASHQHSASDINSGQLALARGGTNANLSATGGAGQFVKQTSVGGAFTVGAITEAELPAHNAATATKLLTARNINGIAFDGTADITVTAAAGTLTGTTLAANVVTSSLTSVGTLGSLNVTGTVTAGAFSGPLTGNVTGNVTGSSGSTTGNAATATALQTGRLINGVSFDGTANISVTGNAAAFSGNATAAVADDVREYTGTGGHTLTLQNFANMVKALTVFHTGTGLLTISGNVDINGAPSITLAGGESITIYKLASEWGAR